jgi:hypothetical protein
MKHAAYPLQSVVSEPKTHKQTLQNGGNSDDVIFDAQSLDSISVEFQLTTHAHQLPGETNT